MKKRIALVDDDPSVLELHKVIFEIEGHEVTGYSSSSAALEGVTRDPPDCLLTDIMMPEMDGTELTRRLRQNPALANLCIVVVSSKVYAADRKRALDAGANGFIPKSRSNPQAMVGEVMALITETISLGFWGTRGTMPMSGPQTLRYGGNTACISLTFPDGHVFVFDAGTGIYPLAGQLMGQGKKLNGTVLLSHPHWDHINFLPFFTPLFVPGNQFEIVGADQDGLSLEQLVANQMDGVHFPITPSEWGARVGYRSLGEGCYDIGPAKVSTMLLCHPGNCLGYRVDFGGLKIAYVTDNELYPEDSDMFSPVYLQRLTEFVSHCDLLITDTSYTDEEYPKRINWGHSALSRVVNLARQAQVKELYLFHHVPEHTDDDIDKMLQQAAALCAGSSTVCKAAQALETVRLNAV
ncbi:MAG: response regulator [Candidatus Eremiobacteraeota bacterium]|nr:response regulator [Candidatus Eremiobacteraeota bacterium]MCW5871802.1 response regulator [Candidatus Eremiobacteraeota bacterium]